MIDTSCKLTPDQLKIVESSAPAIVVTAGAGTGKTEVVARRIEHLLKRGSPPSPVLALTYTVKAANELRDRIHRRLGSLDQYVEAVTIHRFAHSLLLQSGTYIGLPLNIEVLTRLEDRVELIGRWSEDRGMALSEPRRFFAELDLAQARLEDHPQLCEWEAALSSIGAVDYPRMISGAIDLLHLAPIRRNAAVRYGQVIVDEAQNLTPAQYRLLTLLIGSLNDPYKRVPAMLVGDAKQSVVEFAGADHRLMEAFATDYSAERFELRDNFRSARSIARLGTEVAKKLGSSRPTEPSQMQYPARGNIDCYQALEEKEEGDNVANWVKQLLREGIPRESLAPDESGLVLPEDIAVLGRTSTALSYTRRALENLDIEIASAASPEDWLSSLHGRLVLALMDLHVNPQHRSAWWRIDRLLKLDRNGVRTIEALSKILDENPNYRTLVPLCTTDTPEVFVKTLPEISLMNTLDVQAQADWSDDIKLIEETWRQFASRKGEANRTWTAFSRHIIWAQRERPIDPGVRLLTVHKSQGREFRAVAVVGMNQGQFPDFRAKTEQEKSAELRAFYVAVTRPSRMLLLTRSKIRQGRFGSFETERSPYLDLAMQQIGRLKVEP